MENKATISFRIGIGQWMPEDRLNNLLDTLGRHPGIAEEISLFTSETHPPLPIETIEERAEILKQRIPQIKERGYRAGINVLATIGHHNENLPNSLTGAYTRMTDLGGALCLGSLCPNDERTRAYVRQIYQTLAQTGPDFIWIDDDVRLLGHMPIRETCFCDRCMSIFERESGVQYTRETLRHAFDEGKSADKLKVRMAWIEHNRKTMKRLLELIETTVHETSPGMTIGFMTGDRFYEGYDFDKWAEILSRGGGVMWRPGGGFYNEESMHGMAEKSHEIGRQISFLPENVESIQSEIENFPYQLLKKSAKVTTLEAASHIASGCTGAAFNVLTGQMGEPIDEYQPIIDRIGRTRPFYDLMVKTLGRSVPEGLFWYWTKNSFAAINVPGEWIKFGVRERLIPTLEIGIPPAYNQQNASVTAISGDSIMVAKRDDVLQILSGGVYMDPWALARLNDMGYGEYTGFTLESGFEADSIEQLTDHPLNEGIAGLTRDCRQSFWRDTASVLEPSDEQAQVLSRIIDYAGQELASCCMGVYENSLGGRICVNGYYPWNSLYSLTKTTQIKSVMRWLSRDMLPAYVKSYHKMNIWVRRAPDGRPAIVVLNAHMDPAENVQLMIKDTKDKIAVHDMNCEKTEYQPTDAFAPYTEYTIPEIAPWEIRLITTADS